MTSIKEFARKVQNREIDIVKHTKKVLDDAKKINKEYKVPPSYMTSEIDQNHVIFEED